MQKWRETVNSIKKEHIYIIFLVGVLLLVITYPTETKEMRLDIPKESVEQSDDVNSLQEMERKLKEILTSVKGIGEVEVMLHAVSDGRKMLEKDLNESQKDNLQYNGDEQSDSEREITKNENTVMVKENNGIEKPFVSEELTPVIDGAFIIAQGAENPVIKNEITEAVSALFDIPVHKIKVMKME